MLNRNLRNILILTWSLLIVVAAGKVVAQELPADTLLLEQEIPADTIPGLQELVPAGDTAPKAGTEKPEEELHSPRKAAIYSALLPGLGQAYNKKYWKIPLVYGGFATIGYFIGWNNANYKTSKNAYSDLTDDDPNTDSYMKLKYIEYYNLENPSEVENLKRGLVRRQDYFRRNRDLLVILTAAFYGLNIIDASVDAHFFNWDISDDLTMNLKPSVDQFKNQNLFSLNCTIRF